MRKLKFEVPRDDLYAGEVVNRNLKMKQNERYFLEERKRSILFFQDVKNKGNDVMHSLPHYPILGKTKGVEANQSDFLIKNHFSLKPLLEYFGFPENLTKKEILEIRRDFFSGEFGRDNCNLFGYTEKKPFTFHREFYNIDYELHDRCFEQNFNGVLPPNMMLRLDDIGSNNFAAILMGEANCIDTFQALPKEYISVLKEKFDKISDDAKKLSRRLF